MSMYMLYKIAIAKINICCLIIRPFSIHQLSNEQDLQYLAQTTLCYVCAAL